MEPEALAVGALIAVIGVMLVQRYVRGLPVCTCVESDDCTCGGARGEKPVCEHPSRGRARFMEGIGWIAWCPDCREPVRVLEVYDEG